MQFRIFPLIVILLLVAELGSGQESKSTNPSDIANGRGPVTHPSGTRVIADSSLLRNIKLADQQLSIDELVTIINTCTNKDSGSVEIGQALADWLREDHPIYKGKTATEVDRFRGFLLSSLAAFPPNPEVY